MSSSGKEVNMNNDDIVMKCPYCCMKPKGLVWFAHHLAGTGGANIPPCLTVPNNIRNLHKADLLRNTREEDMRNTNGKRVRKASSEEDNLPRSENANEQITEDSSREAKMTIARFFHENRLDASVVTSDSFLSMISLGPESLQRQIAMHEDLKDWISNMNRMEDHINEFKNSWAETGCSVLLDFWSDEMSRSLVNVLVDSPRGTVCVSTRDISDFTGNLNAMMLFVEGILVEVGLNNVVQIITNSTSDFMKELGKCLMAKHRSVFWTVSISSCIDLMLEKMGALNLFKKAFENAKIITRFIHSHPEVLKLFKDLTNGQDLVRPSKKSFLPFLILENIVSEEESLKVIFESELDAVSSWEGKRVADMVLGESFWSAALIVVKATIPLVRLMDWMDTNKSHVGCLYETLEQAKEEIRNGLRKSRVKIGDLRCKKYGYKRFWDMVDEVWNSILHSHLHSGGYFLNPGIYYSSSASLDSEICLGMAWCIMRSTQCTKIQDVMTQQLEMYRNSVGKFGEGCGIREREAVLPATWWEMYGGEHPELQKFAIRILGQTCDGASKFRLQRSLAENLHIKERDPVEQQKLNDWLFSQYNMDLKTFVPGKTYCPSADEIAVMNDWVLDKSAASTSQPAQMNGIW